MTTVEVVEETTYLAVRHRPKAKVYDKAVQVAKQGPDHDQHVRDRCGVRQHWSRETGWPRPKFRRGCLETLGRVESKTHLDAFGVARPIIVGQLNAVRNRRGRAGWRRA